MVDEELNKVRDVKYSIRFSTRHHCLANLNLERIIILIATQNYSTRSQSANVLSICDAKVTADCAD